MKIFHKLTLLITVISLVFTYIASAWAEEDSLTAQDVINKLNYELFTNEIYYAITENVDLSAVSVIGESGAISIDKYGKDRRVMNREYAYFIWV